MCFVTDSLRKLFTIHSFSTILQFAAIPTSVGQTKKKNSFKHALSLGWCILLGWACTQGLPVQSWSGLGAQSPTWGVQEVVNQ